MADLTEELTAAARRGRATGVERRSWLIRGSRPAHVVLGETRKGRRVLKTTDFDQGTIGRRGRTPECRSR